jgi:sporulation protein YlmC with PRC-barrel domain
MLSKHLTAALVGTAFLTVPALAQTTAPAANPPASTTTAASANAGHFVTQEKAGQWRASKLKGLNVYNNNNEKIGDINELLVDKDGKIDAVVVGVGGFLGMGEHDVAVPFSELKFVDQPRANTTASTANPSAPAPAPATTTAANTNANAPANTTGTVAANRTAADTHRSYPDHAMLNMTKDQLKAAPEFKFAR